MNTLIKRILLLSCLFTQSFAHAAVYNQSAKETNQVFEKKPSSSKKLKDIKFEDAALNLCVKDAAGKNGNDAIFADEIKDLTCSNIGSLTGIEFLSSLNQLVLFKTEIKDLTPISSLTDLRRLIIEGSQIDDVSPLSHLSNLSLLILKKAHIENIEPLRNLSELVFLELSNNRIKSVVALDKLTKLMKLGLEGNPLNCTQVADLYVKLIASQEKTKHRYTSINPTCEHELSERQLDILAAKESIQKKPKPTVTPQQKEKIKRDQNVRMLIFERNTNGLSSWLEKNPNALTDFKINNMPLFILAVQDSFNSPNNYEDFPFLEWLLERGADVNSKDEDEKTALNHLYEHGEINTKNKLLLKLLLKHGADINYAPPSRSTILVAAVSSGEGNLDWVKELIALGADINGQGGQGGTALMMSYSNEFYEIFDYLLDAGANIHLRNKIGATLIHGIAWHMNSKENDERSEKAKYYAVKLLERKLKFDYRSINFYDFD